MYDVSANLLSWISLLLGAGTFLQVLFTYHRDTTAGIVAVLIGLAAYAIMGLIDTKLTSSSLSRIGRNRCMFGIGLAAAALLLIATSDPSKRPAAEQPPLARLATGSLPGVTLP